jgi:retinol dehydrogenase-13
MAPFNIDGSTVLITGGNTGIGKETARALASQGARVIITSRNTERGRNALAEIREDSGRDDVEVMSLDLASFQSIRAFAKEFTARFDRLDVLVNNAGVVKTQTRGETADGFELMFGVNHLGHFLLTNLLLDTIKASAPARIVNLASHGYMLAAEGLDFDDLQNEGDFKGFALYGHSKLANIYFTRELARRLEGTGVTVNALHPGFVKTELGHVRPEDLEAQKAAKKSKSAKSTPSGPDLSKLPPPLPVEEGALTSIYCASSPELEGVTGGYFDQCKAIDTNEIAADAAAARRLWEISEELVASVPTS